MNSASEPLRTYIDGFKTFESRNKGAAAWLRDLRHDAFARFSA